MNINKYLKLSFSILGIIFIIGTLFVIISGSPNNKESIGCSKGKESVFGNDKLKFYVENNKCCGYIVDKQDNIGVECQMMN